jgi:hypothetical protein
MKSIYIVGVVFLAYIISFSIYLKQLWNAESTSRRRTVKEELEDVLLGELQFPCSTFLVSTNFPMHT